MSNPASWISKDVQRCGGDACIRDTRISVWNLVEWRRLGQSDADIRRAHPDLTEADLAVAWDYAAAHADEIEKALWENEACMIDQDQQPLPVDLVRRGRQLGFTDEQICNAFEPPLSPEVLDAALPASGRA